MNSGSHKIRVGVSSCLLGYDVRYDGKNKKNDNVIKLSDTFDLMAICPEYGIGMGVPRAPINIINVDGKFHARGVANPGYDVTESLQELAEAIIKSHKDLCGYVFKARSPSCGLDSTPWFDTDGNEKGLTSGIFSQQVQMRLPDLPMIEETQLTCGIEIEQFIERVNNYANVNRSP